MLPVSGAEQLNTSGAMSDRPVSSHMGAYSKLVNPGPHLRHTRAASSTHVRQ